MTGEEKAAAGPRAKRSGAETARQTARSAAAVFPLPGSLQSGIKTERTARLCAAVRSVSFLFCRKCVSAAEEMAEQRLAARLHKAGARGGTLGKGKAERRLLRRLQEQSAGWLFLLSGRR